MPVFTVEDMPAFTVEDILIFIVENIEYALHIKRIGVKLVDTYKNITMFMFS